MSPAIRPRATEAQCEDAIIDAARLAGWRVHAERPARTNKGHRTPIKGHAGWPDLVLARGDRLLVIELKRHPNKPTADQRRWIAQLKAAGVDARVVWVPEGMDALLDELTEAP